MAIVRSCVKAIVFHENKILLNTCRSQQQGDFYTLPGGGQRPNETLEEAVIRECLEETGLAVRLVKLAGLYEEINHDPHLVEQLPSHVHRVFHIFLCTLDKNSNVGTLYPPLHPDTFQTGCTWVEVQRLEEMHILPEALGIAAIDAYNGKGPIFFGSKRVH